MVKIFTTIAVKEPLCIYPLKWFRFVAFAICGSRGHLFPSTAVGTRCVDYENSVTVETSRYYYVPEGPLCFIDPEGLNDRLTSSVHTQRRSDIVARDGPRCIITLEEKGLCQAVHILPRSKGNEYICKVVADRSHLYDPSQRLNVSDIDDIRNGIFLSTNLHLRFSRGSVAFMKTPNFALGPEDIPIVRPAGGPIPQHRLTLHNLAPPEGRYPILCDDANYSPTEDSPPPAILLDYMYGVAAYNRWKVAAIQPVEQYFIDHYESIPQLPRPEPSDSGSGFDEPDDPCDPCDGHGHSSRRGLAEAMDEMNAFLMSLSGVTPQAITEKWQRKEEETQLKAKEESEAKVVEWLQREVHPV